MSARQEAREHGEIGEFVPWYVNETLDEEGRARVEAHIGGCAECRRELEAEQRIRDAMSRESTVEYIPTASLNRLRARLEGQAAEPPRPSAVRHVPWLGWQGLMAASVVLTAVALGFLAVEHWRSPAGGAAAPYYTVTAPRVRVPHEAIRAVFAPDVTLVQLEAVLDDARLRIVAGPSEAGVYSLAQTGEHGSVAEALTRLRGHAEVRFAESTEIAP